MSGYRIPIGVRIMPPLDPLGGGALVAPPGGALS